MILTIVVSAILLVLIAGCTFVVARYLPILVNLFLNVTVRRRPEQDAPLEGEEVHFETADGVRLAGTLSEGDASAPVVVFCHEFTSNRQSASKYAGFMREAGYRIFAFDFRGHGDAAKPDGYMPRQWATEYEMSDLRAALRYLRSREDLNASRVGLFGVSRGAVTALAVAADDPNVAGVVSDGAFCTEQTLEAYIIRWAPIFALRFTRQLLRQPLFRALRWMGIKFSEHRIGIRFVKLAPALQRLKKPVLFIHGEKDTYIDPAHARRLFELPRGRREFWIVAGADHNQAVAVAHDEYRRRVLRFFRSVLAVGKPVKTVAERQVVGKKVSL